MADHLVSVDEFLNARKDFVKGGDVLLKAGRAAPSWNAEKRTIRFTMSAEVEDRDRDIVVQAGLNTDEFLKNPIAPFQHASNTFPVGVWSDVEKLLNGRPKRTEGTLNLLPEGKDGVADRLAFHLEHGTIKACSIGFIPKAVEKRPAPEDKRDSYFWPGYMIHEAELVECSPVSIPANPAALAKMAKEGDKLAAELIEEVLDNWVKHPETGLLMPRAEFEAAHKEATGTRTTFTLHTRADGTSFAEFNVPQHEVTSNEIVIPAVAEKDEQGLFRRFLAFLGGDGVKATVQNEVQGELAEQAADEAAVALRAAVEEAERRSLEREVSALEGRLAAKGI